MKIGDEVERGWGRKVRQRMGPQDGKRTQTRENYLI